ncbi:hypothetical protein HK097_009213, partial [Rhizophlyctis rosea]
MLGAGKTRPKWFRNKSPVPKSVKLYVKLDDREAAFRFEPTDDLESVKGKVDLVLLCSLEALERVKKANEEADNMLLEWEIALDKLQRSECYVLPVLVGHKKLIETKNGELLLAHRRFFDDFDSSLAQFPDTYHVHPQSPQRHKIRGLLKTLLNLQAVERWPDDVGDIARDASEMYARSTREHRRNLSPSERDTLAADAAISRIRQILKPIDFENERRRLRDAHVAGTRMWLLDEIFQWLEDRESRVFWLKGDAGVGKSVMAGRVANALQGELHLGTAFFCKHDDVERRDAKKMIHTIACGLAHWDHRIALHLDKLLKKHTKIMSESIPEQFAALVLGPLTAVPQSEETVVLVVDAIDECGAKHSRRDILNVLSTECAKLPPFVKLFITSRMEEDIVAAFTTLEPYKLLDPKDWNNVHDIAVTCRSMLLHATEGLECSEENLLSLVDMMVEKSAGVFVWLTMAEPFLSGCKSMGDVRHTVEELPSNVDGLYEGTLRKAYEKFPELSDIVPIVVVSQHPLSVTAIASLLHLDASQVLAALQSIAGIMKFDDVVKVSHKSLTDYLTNPSKCKDKTLLVDAQHAHTLLGMKCLETLNTLLRPNMCNLPTEKRSRNADIPNLKELLAEHLPEHLEYAACYWIDHVMTRGEGDVEQLLPLIGDFLTKKLLDWFEILSLLGKSHVNAVIWKLEGFQMWLKNHCSNKQWHALAKDAWRFQQEFHSLVSNSSAHIRWSAFPFCPHNTELYRLYQTYPENQPLPTVQGTNANWSPCLRTFEGHENSVECVTVSSKERYLVTCSMDMTVKVWDVKTGSLQMTIRERFGIYSVRVTSDEQCVVKLSHDHSITVWDLAKGTFVRKIEPSEGKPAFKLDLSPDGQMVAAASLNEKACIWNLHTGDLLRTLVGHEDCVRAVAFSGDGVHIVTGSVDRSAKIWRTGTGVCVATLKGHEKAVDCVAFSRDGRWVVTGSADHTARVWDMTTGLATHVLEGHAGKLKEVTINWDCTRIATASGDKTAKVWDLATGLIITTLEGHLLSVWTVALSRHGMKVVTGSADRTVKVWDVADSAGAEASTVSGSTVCSTAVSQDGKRVVTGSVKSIGVWDMASGEQIWTKEAHEDSIVSVAISGEGNRLVTGSNDCTAKLWDMAAGGLLCVLEGHRYRVNAVAIAHDGCMVVTGSFDATAKVWDNNGSLLWTLEGHSDSVQTVALSTKEALVVSGSTDRTMR